MATITLGIGDLAAAGLGDTLQTMALGSCVGLVLYDAGTRCSGLVHVALPESGLYRAGAGSLPGRFADTAVPALLDAMARKGGRWSRGQPVAKLVGGARILDSRNVFGIGMRNLAALRTALREHGLRPVGEETGGAISRNVCVDAGTGHVRVWSAGVGAWAL